MNKSNTLRIEARSSPFAVPMRMNMIFVRNQQLTCLKCLLIFQPKPTNWCANHRCPYFVWGRARAPNLYAACGGQSFINNFRVIAIGKYHILYTLVWCTSNCSVSIYACVQTHGLVRRSADWTFFSCSESIPEQNDYLSNINEMHCNELVFRSLCEIVFWLMRWCIVEWCGDQTTVWCSISDLMLRWHIFYYQKKTTSWRHIFWATNVGCCVNTFPRAII